MPFFTKFRPALRLRAAGICYNIVVNIIEKPTSLDFGEVKRRMLGRLNQPIAEAALRLGAQRVILFGSRARGDCRARSDVDLAVCGMPKEHEAAFRDALEALPTLLAFDVVFVTPSLSPELLKNIEKDGIVLMDKAKEKAANLLYAVNRLQEAIREYDSLHYASMRDGAIQRFEFCVELAWKALREHLLAQGYANINSPKSVMKQAYADGLLSEETVWLQILNDRNLTSHIYDEAAAEEIYQRIAGSYCALLRSLAEKLNG